MNLGLKEDKHVKFQLMPKSEQGDFFRNLGYGEEVKSKRTHLQKFKDNWKSGATVALVNLPLSISLAVASGTTPQAGIMSGIVAGIISGFFGGSNFNIVGPTGALSGFLLTGVKHYGTASLPYYALVTGLFCFLCRLWGIERYIDLFPTAVNEGFTLGIALIIFLGQMNNFLGIGKFTKTEEVINDDGLPSTIIHLVEQFESEESIIHSVVNNILHIHQMNINAFVMFLIFFVSLYILLRRFPTFPWMMIAAIIGVVIGHYDFQVETIGTRFTNLEFQIIDLSYLSVLSPLILLDPRFWVDCIPIAFVAILETLISAKVADSMTNTKFNKQRELRGLTLSNLVCGIFGGIPVTAALARTALNIKSGCTHKYSSTINGVVMFILSGLFLNTFSYLPLAVVAAQVCIVAVRMINFEELGHLKKTDKGSFFIVMFIAFICIMRDPTVGIIFGMLLYLLGFCENLTRTWTEIVMVKEKKKETPSISGRDSFEFDNTDSFTDDIPREEGDFLLYRIIGSINFMNVIEHVDKIKFILKDNRIVVISLKYVHFIDVEALTALKSLFTKIEKELEKFDSKYSYSKKRRMMLTGVNQKTIDEFRDNEWIKNLFANDAIRISKY